MRPASKTHAKDVFLKILFFFLKILKGEKLYEADDFIPRGKSSKAQRLYGTYKRHISFLHYLGILLKGGKLVTTS